MLQISIWRPEFWIGTTLGALVTIGLLEPALGTIRSMFSPDHRLVKMQERLDDLQKRIEMPRAELIQELTNLKDRFDVEAASSQVCRTKVTDLEFKLDAKNSPGAKPDEACLREVDSVKGITLRRGETSRQVGGRIHIGTDAMLAGYEGKWWCRINVSTDSSKEKISTYLNVGESIVVKTTVGDFRLVVARIADDNKGSLCQLDLVRR